MPHRARVLPATACLAALLACEGAPSAPAAPMLALAPAALTLIEGQPGAFALRGADGTPTDAELTWRVAPSGLADVHGAGRLTARGVGQGLVEVLDMRGRVRAAAPLDVRPLAECLLSLRPSSRGLTLVIGEQRRLRTAAATCDATLAVDTSAAYAVDDTSVASIDAGGVVLGRRPGVTTVRVASRAAPDVGGSAQVTVVCNRLPLVALSLLQPALRVATGDTVRLHPRLAVEGPTCLADHVASGVRYVSGDPARLRVDEHGLARARRAGTVQVLVVSAAFPNVTATATVTVADP